MTKRQKEINTIVSVVSNLINQGYDINNLIVNPARKVLEFQYNSIPVTLRYRNCSEISSNINRLLRRVSELS